MIPGCRTSVLYEQVKTPHISLQLIMRIAICGIWGGHGVKRSLAVTVGVLTKRASAAYRPPCRYNEDLIKALASFRAAIQIDSRHYNAWYGLGMVYYRQEKHDLAEYHFARAIEINASSPVLLCYLGMVQHAQHHSAAALESITRALEMAPENPLVLFNKGMVLFAIGRAEEALVTLEKLKDLAPKESAVYFLIGKIYAKQGDASKARFYFAWAFDLVSRTPSNKRHP